MDLIRIKEILYDPESEEYDIISGFITHLIDIQGNNINLKVLGNQDIYWKRFYERQEMIELAYKINNLQIFK